MNAFELVCPCNTELNWLKKFVSELQTPLNTTEVFPDPNIECTHANEYFGCLNGVPYDWSVSIVIKKDYY